MNIMPFRDVILRPPLGSEKNACGDHVYLSLTVLVTKPCASFSWNSV